MSAAPMTADQPKRWSLRSFLALDLLDNRYPALHGMRVFAIVSVIQYHVTWIFAGEQGIRLDRGFVDGALKVFFGMDLFFVLSGFLIGSILLRSLEVQGTQNLRRFYIRRIFRTFPSYWVVLTVLACAFVMTEQQKAHLPYEYIYGTNFLPLERSEVIMFWGWSLSLEEQFYLTVPILFFVLHRLRSDRARVILLALLWLTALLIRLLIFFRGTPWDDFILYGTIYFRTLTRFDTLIAGILLALVHNRYGARIQTWLREPFHRAILALPCLACLWFLLRPDMFGPTNVQLCHMFLWGSVTSLMYFGLLLLILHGPVSVFHRIFSLHIWRRAATVGYGVYLVHIPLIDHVFVPIAQAAQRRGYSMIWVWPASLIATTLASFFIAYWMHVLIEKPSLWVRQRLAE